MEFSKNHNELPLLISTNHSAKHIHVKPQSKIKKHLRNSTDFDNNGNTIQNKRCITEKNNVEMKLSNRNKITHD